jgi:hypothetical protein
VDRKILILIALGVLVSGCIDDGGGRTGGNEDEIPDEGLKIEQFTISDKTLAPDQEASITLTLKNFNEKSVNFHDIQLLNTGELIIEEPDDCGDGSSIKERRGEIIGTKECVWTVSTEGVNDFQSKNIPMTLYLKYDMSSTSDTFKITFKPIEEIGSSGEVEGSHSNTEVKTSWETKSPLPYEGKSTIEFTVQNVGPGKVVNKEYKLEYQPKKLFEDCKNREKREVIVGNKLEFTCRLGFGSDPGSEQTTESLFVTTNYTYVRQKQKNIKLVNLEQ